MPQYLYGCQFDACCDRASMSSPAISFLWNSAGSFLPQGYGNEMTNLLQQPSLALGNTSRTIPYSFRIGVTGHRNLAEWKVPAIEVAVRSMLARLEQILVETSTGAQAYAVIKPTTLRQWTAWLVERIDFGL